MKLTRIQNRECELKEYLVACGHDNLVVDVLVNRGYSREMIEALLETGYSTIPSATGLTNIEVGADIIQSHIDNGSTIYIFGDYDSDGVNSVYILGDAINNAIYYSESNAQLQLKVPERHEGYGLNMNWCRQITEHEGTKLVITVDNGIAQDKEVAYLLSQGIDVLITDHHRPNGHTPKNVWIIDAFYNNDDENNKGLCGAGVAFKLAKTLLDRYSDCVDVETLYCKYVIHVAIATITDSMPMTLDNIAFVYNGIQLLKDGYGSEALDYYREYNANTDLTPKDIAFGIGPQLNACGRMNNTKLALNYLFAEEDEIEDLYNEIIVTNDERKEKTKKAIETIESLINVFEPSCIEVLNNVEGIAGIIASNVSSKYNKCTIIFSEASNKDYLIGSARSVGNIDLLSLLRSLNTDAIVKLGGHSGACGITIKAAQINEFKQLVNEAICSLPVVEVDEDYELEIVVDDIITIANINKETCDALNSLYFFTESNPIFVMNVTIDKTKSSRNNPNNVEFTISDYTTKSFSFWSWGIGDHYRELGEPKDVILVGEIEYKFGKPSFNILNIIPKGEITLD